MILYVMLCGRLPFDDEYIPSLFRKINGMYRSEPAGDDSLLLMGTSRRDIYNALVSKS